MDASILLVGSDGFRLPLLDLIQDLATFTVEVAANPLEAMPLIQAQQPDLLLIQASQTGSLELCRQVKAQNRLAWIYCILLDDQVYDFGSDWYKEAEIEAESLDVGADAYLKFLSAKDIAVSPFREQMVWQVGQQGHLLQAQIRAGLRRVQNHRDLMRANDVLSAIALLDPLTDLNNRRAFEWELPRQIQNARSRGNPISLILLDVDYFKTINDTYGHLVGDCALKLLAARLRHNLRLYDTPFRYGGEEFVIILSNTDGQEVSTIAKRLCQLIGDQPFAIDDALDLTITISAGATTLKPEDDARGISLLQRADQYLLQAKSQGRNRIVS